MPGIPNEYHPVGPCPYCGEIGPIQAIADREGWTCGCGMYKHYPYNTRVEREMHSLLLIHIHPMFKSSRNSRKSKRYGNKKVTSFMNRYYLDT
jgi:hypothetical protein